VSGEERAAAFDLRCCCPSALSRGRGGRFDFAFVGAKLAREDGLTANPILALTSVGAAAGCDLLILLLVLKDQRQKIAAFGSSYRGGV
jgi:hypothetical protein